MNMPSISSTPHTVEDIFKDFSDQRSGIIHALTHDVDEFYALCDPDKENPCLYGHTDSSWEVTLPMEEEVPPKLPESVLEINFTRDGMNCKDCLSLVAVHSDPGLLSVALYMGARFNGNERGARAFLYPHGRNMNDVPIPKGMLSSIPYDMRGMPIRDAGISQPVPTVALPSALANATPDQQRMMLGKSLYPLVEMLKQIMRPK